jgi:trehalose-6-phosphate synthase
MIASNPDIKTCEGCGEDFGRPARLDNLRWRARRYCSQRCGLLKVGLENHGKNGSTNADSVALKSAEVGSEALRARIIAMFERTATAKGISLEQAAFLHLCPAR